MSSSSGIVLPEFVQARIAVWDRLHAAKASAAAANAASSAKKSIKVTLPDGKELAGVAGETTPLQIAEQISSGLARAVLVAQVDDKVWDLTRPLEADCRLALLKFESDDAAKNVFWHSSAHILGQALEIAFGGQLCIGPPLDNGGFYYDIATAQAILAEDFERVQKLVASIVKENQPFERMVLTKAEALELFAANKYKLEIISKKIGDAETTTAYRCGPLIDLCRGPHISTTKKVEAFKLTKNSSAYWLGNAANDSLQRVYGISFPTKKLLKEWEDFQEKAAQRDHRVIGRQQDLFFFDPLSPGSAFWLPHGARIYSKLIEFMRNQYHKRGFTEVITPNIYNHELWRISGHLENYAENIFSFKTREGEDYALKPMNCPGHCLMFKHTVRSYRDLPIRYADFGVLHRNEITGALGGLTRVRRFQQDDAHIFCMPSQVQSEVAGCIEFIEAVYGLFNFKFEIALSTRPVNYIGEVAVWDKAEEALKQVLDDFSKRTGKPWKLNPGDGAFYGPKLDIQVKDALNRPHQCATIQLDFQLPLRFELKYVASEESAQPPPVIIHRAIFGSLERFTGILMEHTGGRWPLWLSPRQICIVPVAPKFDAFAEELRLRLHNEGLYVDVHSGEKTMNKRIAEASKQQYNYIVVVGDKEVETASVNVRARPKRDQEHVPTVSKTIVQFIDELKQEVSEFRVPADQDWINDDNDAAPTSAALPSGKSSVAAPVAAADGMDF
jgi:threonyl-tRNA synthetase